MLIPMEDALPDLPALTADESRAADIIHGRAVSPDDLSGNPPESGAVRLLGPDGRLLAVGRLSRAEPQKLGLACVFPPEGGEADE
ncbi:MAG: tRNA pseudouridine(55) synthase TruB [Deltaproteobacteria bacterium]|nr:tRNA pseudouridine(55) synthase TruB [Deltaproteobacteria bacterium]